MCAVKIKSDERLLDVSVLDELHEHVAFLADREPELSIRREIRVGHMLFLVGDLNLVDPDAAASDETARLAARIRNADFAQELEGNKPSLDL